MFCCFLCATGPRGEHRWCHACTVESKTPSLSNSTAPAHPAADVLPPPGMSDSYCHQLRAAALTSLTLRFPADGGWWTPRLTHLAKRLRFAVQCDYRKILASTWQSSVAASASTSVHGLTINLMRSKLRVSDGYTSVERPGLSSTCCQSPSKLCFTYAVCS